MLASGKHRLMPNHQLTVRYKPRHPTITKPIAFPFIMEVSPPIGQENENKAPVVEATVRMEEPATIDEGAEEAERERLRREREARAQALTLEIVGDLPYAEVKPPENVLFVCKLNPVTEGQHISLSYSTQQSTKMLRLR